jgi:3-phosphoshikimate 1-carboxyvinyltransferase
VRIGPAWVSGRRSAPPSKSYTHRALVVSYLSGGRCTLERPLDSEDTLATRRGVEALGRRCRTVEGRWEVEAASASRPADHPIHIACGRSGTTLRFLAVVAATLDREVVLEGEAELAARPIGPLLAVLEAAGARVRRLRGRRSVPLSVHGPLGAVDAEVDASESSQYLSALLLVLPTRDGDSRLRLRGPLVSRPYVESTLDTMRRSGVRVSFNGPEVLIPGGQRYRAGRLAIPGDASSAAYLWAAGAAAVGPVRVDGVPRDRPQADLAVLGVLESMGARVSRHPGGATVGGAPLVGIDVELTGSPDLYPLVGVLAAMASGESRLRGAPHVVLKESDRRRATIALARAMGASARVVGSDVVIRGTPHPRALDLSGCDDHRVVMSAAVGALAAAAPSAIGEAESVRKSYPDFWRDMRTLGATSRRVRP